MKDKDKKNKKSLDAVNSYCEDNKQIPSDIFGSYTGVSEDNDKPMQDGDDI